MNRPDSQYIPREHIATDEQHRRLTVLFDEAFRIPGTGIRFGVDALLGLVPGAGDLAGALVAGYGILLARRIGVPGTVQLRMLGNVAIDLFGGSVPVIGDLFDVAFKAHTRNRLLLDRWQAEPSRVERISLAAMLAIPLLALLALGGVAALTIVVFRSLAGALQAPIAG